MCGGEKKNKYYDKTTYLDVRFPPLLCRIIPNIKFNTHMPVAKSLP